MKKDKLFLFLVMIVISIPIVSSIIRILINIPNDISIFSSRRLIILSKTLSYGLIVSLLTCLIGAMVAYFLVKRIKNVRILSLYILCLMGIPPYFYAYMAMDFSRVFLNMHYISGFMVSVVVEVMYLLPLSISAWLLFMTSVPIIFIEEAIMDTDKKHAVLYVLMNLMRQPAKSLFFLLILLSINDYTIPSIFAYNTYPIEVMTVFSSQTGLVAPFMTSLPIMLISLLFMGLVISNWQQTNIHFQVEENKFYQRQKKSYLVIGLILIYIVMPISLMGLGLFNKNMSVNLNQSFLTDLVFGHSAAIIAGLVMTISTYYICYIYMVFFNLRKFILVFLVVLFSIPGTLSGLMVNEFYQWLDSILKIDLYSTIIPMIHLLTIRYMAVGFLIIWIGMNYLSTSAIEVALLHTNSVIKIIYKVIWPYNKYYVVSAFLVMTILATGELAGSIMVVPPGKSTMTITIYNYLHYGSGDVVSFLVMIMFLMILILSTIIVITFVKLEKEKG